MADEWRNIDPEYPLKKGDIIRIWYNTIGLTYITAAQIALAEKKLEQEKTFFVRSHSLPRSDNSFLSEFYFEVEVVEPPKEAPEGEGSDPQQAAIITGALIGKIILAALAIGILWATVKIIQIKYVKAIGESAEGLESLSKIVMAIAAIIIVAVILGFIK